MTLDWQAIKVLEGDVSETPCDCCGKTTVEVAGDLEHSEDWIGFYWVRFSKGHPEALPIFRVGTGNWAEDAPKEERWIFGLDYSKEHNAFRLLDMKEEQSDSATYLNRDDIMDTDFAKDAFAMIDAIFMKDTRISEWLT